MKAYLLNKNGEIVPYIEHNYLIGPIKFLYYEFSGKKLLLIAPALILIVDAYVCHSDLQRYAVEAKFIPENEKPLGCGLYSTQRKIFDDWESVTMDVTTPEKYRPIIEDFLRSL